MELRRSSYSDELDLFYMREIIVDGVYGRNTREYGYQFYTVKKDFWDEEERQVSEDGYLDDTDDIVAWESPYIPLPQKFGDVDVDHWVRYGEVVGTRGRFI